MEMMVAYGMKPIDVLRSATSVNARIFGVANVKGSLATGLRADIIAVEGNPVDDISNVRNIKLVMAAGVLYKTPLVDGK
jgi:imidazolonepropionase-like amidohydrolase